MGGVADRASDAFVASWIYVFGVGALAALGVAIVSGFGLALGGPDWWHYNPAGHFFNSLHVWSVELFMALLVIHLWGKFWMAAWRDRRTWTWITGVVAFVASVVECELSACFSRDVFRRQPVYTYKLRSLPLFPRISRGRGCRGPEQYSYITRRFLGWCEGMLRSRV
jgi:hypothetical protein